MSDTFLFQCPSCQAQLVLPRSVVGKKGKCPSCHAVVELALSANANMPAPAAASQEALGESLGHEDTLVGQRDTPEIERSVGDQATGGDMSRSDTARSLGDKSTSGDALSSFSDADGSIDELDDSIPLVDLSERYEIQGTLGQGGMGEVLQAFDKRLQRPVAIKRVLSKMAHSRKALSRFLTEAQSIAALNHFNIVQIYDYGRDEQGPFIIMELVEGQSLLEKLKSGPLELEEAIELACQLCDGLAVAHERGIIHRDIKPANILLTKRGEPKLTDFGLARQDSVDHGQTQAGAVLGTIDFMPPEQRQDATAVDARSDLWSLAATLYQVLTGKSPRVIRLDQVAQSLRPVLGQALEDNPAERYQSAGELHAALKLVLTQASATVASTSDGPFSEGRCPNCATVNDASRKFCDSCGQPMQETCLSCGHLNSPWNRICGECGSNLQELITAKQEEIDEQKVAVESLRREYRYEEALRQLQELKELDHPRFAGDKSWAENNASSLEAEHVQQKENILVTAEEAIQEMNKGKFTEAIKLLEGVPTPLRDEKVLRLLKQSQGNQHEKERLLEEIKQRVATNNLAGLLDKTTRFLVLSPGHAQIEKMHAQLRRRHEDTAAKVMGILARAEQLFDQHKDEAVLKTLDECPEEFRQENAFRVFHSHATRRLARVGELDAAIASEASPDTKLRLVESYLELRPGDPSMQHRASALQKQLQTAGLKKENRKQNKRILIGLVCLITVVLLILATYQDEIVGWKPNSAQRSAAETTYSERMRQLREAKNTPANKRTAEQKKLLEEQPTPYNYGSTQKGPDVAKESTFSSPLSLELFRLSNPVASRTSENRFGVLTLSVDIQVLRTIAALNSKYYCVISFQEIDEIGEYQITETKWEIQQTTLVRGASFSVDIPVKLYKTAASASHPSGEVVPFWPKGPYRFVMAVRRNGDFSRVSQSVSAVQNAPSKQE